MSDTERARTAAQNAVDAYLASDGISEGYEDSATVIVDLITDLMHLADSLGHSGEYVADRAADFYADEQPPILQGVDHV